MHGRTVSAFACPSGADQATAETRDSEVEAAEVLVCKDEHQPSSLHPLDTGQCELADNGGRSLDIRPTTHLRMSRRPSTGIIDPSDEPGGACLRSRFTNASVRYDSGPKLHHASRPWAMRGFRRQCGQREFVYGRGLS